jgi:hypothetical protein
MHSAGYLIPTLGVWPLIRKAGWLLVAGAYVLGSCVYVRCLYRGHACIHNGQYTLLLQGDLSPRCEMERQPWPRHYCDRCGFDAVCHTLHTQSHSSTLLRLCVSILWARLHLSIYRVLDCRHISPWGRCVNMSAKSHCCRRGLRFVLMK